jgi:hypothetical protein
MPTCGEHWALDEANYPKNVYWDQIEPLTGAVSIHFYDTLGLADFDCPDTSHLDASDAPDFSARFSQVLAERLNSKLTSTSQSKP